MKFMVQIWYIVSRSVFRLIRKWLETLVIPARLERATYCLEGRDSPFYPHTLSHRILYSSLLKWLNRYKRKNPVAVSSSHQLLSGGLVQIWYNPLVLFMRFFKGATCNCTQNLHFT